MLRGWKGGIQEEVYPLLIKVSREGKQALSSFDLH